MSRDRLYVILKEVRARSVQDAITRESHSAIIECSPKRSEEHGSASAIGFMLPCEDEDE